MRLALALASLRRRAAALTIAAVFLVAPASDALACSCGAPSSPDLAVMSVGIAFRGRVVATEALGVGPEARQRAYFEVDRLWKGQLAPRISFLAGGMGSLCHVTFRVGQEVTVFADRRNGEIVTGACTMFQAHAAGPALAKLQEEVEAAEVAVRAAPGAVRPLLAKADLLRRWRDHERALVLYQEVLNLSPGSIEAHAGMALSLIALRREAEAIALLDLASARLGQHGDFQRLGRLARMVAGQPWDGGPLEFREADISRLDWSGRSFPGVDFTGAYLTSVRLERSRMPGARFDRAWLYGVWFSHADLAQARFDGGMLEGVRMHNANLQQARFHDTRFGGDRTYSTVHLDDADLRGARFVRASGFPVVKGANMQQAWLEQVGLTTLQFFEGTDLTGATILESRIETALFSQARLDRARLTNVHVRNTTLMATSVDNAIFRNVTFDQVRYSPGLDQRQATPLRTVDLRGARLINVRIQPPPQP